MGFMRRALTCLTRAASFIKQHPGAWASETTTVIGFALIVIAVWEVYTKALTVDQAIGMVTVGAGMLYPQSAAKQAATTALVSAVVNAVAEHKEDPPSVQEHKK